MSKRPAARWPCVARLSFLLARRPVTRRAKACGRCPVDGGVREFPLQRSEACRKRQKMRRRGATPATALSSSQADNVLLRGRFHFPQFPEPVVRQLPRMRGTTELTPPLSVWVSCLADRGGLVSVPGRAHLVGHSRHLLLELAMARPALGFGDCICGLRDLGYLVRASKAHVRRPDRAVSRRGRVVDIHLSLA